MTSQPLFEYACYEGNSGMMNLMEMESARVLDARPVAGASKQLTEAVDEPVGEVDNV